MADAGFVLLSLDQRHFEVQAVFTGDFPRHVRDERQVWSATGAAAGADHQRHFRADGGAEHQLQITADGNWRAERLARPEVMRAGIDAAAVDADRIGASFQPGLQRRFGKAVAQDGGGRQ